MNDVLRFARDYRDLGHAVTEQFEAVLSGEGVEEQNPNAIDMILRFLEAYSDTRNEDIQELIEMFIDAVDEHRGYDRY